MLKIAIIGVLQQQAEALGTQYQPIYALYNDMQWNTNLNEMKSSDKVDYIPYSAVGIKQETTEILKIIKKISPDIIYINSLRQLLIIGLIIRMTYLFKSRPIIIATSHNSKVWQSFLKRLLMAMLLNSMADGVLTLAKFQEKWLRKYGISYLKIRTISNPVDTDQFSPEKADSQRNSSETPVLVNFAGIKPVKSQDTLIHAIRLVKMEFPKVKLILTGGQRSNSEYVLYIKDLITKYEVNKNVIFSGYIQHQQIPQRLRASDISLLSSTSEVCPFVVLESLSTGKVMISTAVGGIPDLITDGYNGFLLKPGDIKGFADCILRVLNDHSLRMSIERNARETAVSNFSYQAIGEKHKEFISTLIHNKSVRS